MPWRSVACAKADIGSLAPTRAPADTPRTWRRLLTPAGPRRQLGRFFSVPPPDRGESRQPIFRQRGWSPEAIPTRRAHHAGCPLRHDIEIPQQHAVERVSGGDQLRAVLREDDAIDQLVHRGILDADQVARSRLVRSLRSPIATLLVPGRERLTPVGNDNVKIELPQAVFVLR